MKSLLRNKDRRGSGITLIEVLAAATMFAALVGALYSVFYGALRLREDSYLAFGPYLAGGAVVKGAVIARGSNIRICGRGILDGSDYEWRKGPHPVTIGIYGSNVTVSGITIRGSSHWTIVPRGSRHVTIRNVKLCNSRVQNDDGVNPCNSQDVLITDCFIRSDDDCVALKGLDFSGANSNVEGIVVEDSILWCDRARIFLLGHESRAAFMRNVVFRNLDIIHFSMTAFLLEPGEEMRLEDVRIEDIRVHGEGQRELVRLRPVVNQYMRKKVPGFVHDVHFKNIRLEGQRGEYLVELVGADESHGVRDVTFENVTILGEKLGRDSKRLRIGPHVQGARFPAAGERAKSGGDEPRSEKRVSSGERSTINSGKPNSRTTSSMARDRPKRSSAGCCQSPQEITSRSRRPISLRNSSTAFILI